MELKHITESNPPYGKRRWPVASPRIPSTGDPQNVKKQTEKQAEKLPTQNA